jgi:hypothetical protein
MPGGNDYMSWLGIWKQPTQDMQKKAVIIHITASEYLLK